VWRRAALGLAVVVVALLGAVVALLTSDSGTTRAIVEVVERPPPEVEPPAPPIVPPPVGVPVEHPPPVEDSGPRRAASGALPPSVDAPLDVAPDLLEVDGERYAPIALKSWDDRTVEGTGADGVLYAIPRGRVTKIESREDLQRRADVAAARLAPEDVEGRIALATWCARRLLVADAKQLAREALRLRPGAPGARELLAQLGEG